MPKRVRRVVFGRDPALYDRARLPYPARVYEILTQRCGLGPGSAVFEVGPGTGIATRELLRRGADPLVLVEADRRLARFLARTLRPGDTELRIIARPFEEVRLPAASFDLGVAATSFHWLPARRALRGVARALRPGGWWVAWYSHTGDPLRPGAFQAAVQPLYRALRQGRPPSPPGPASERRARERRLADLKAVPAFRRISREEVRREVVLPTERIRALWSTFSDIATLAPRRREWFLSELVRLCEREFGGAVTLPTRTTIYSACRQ